SSPGPSSPAVGCFVAPRAAEMSIETVDARVQLAADEPFRVRRLPLEDAGPGLEPFQLPGERRPECLRILLAALIYGRVGDPRGFAPGLGRRDPPVLAQQRVDFIHTRDCSPPGEATERGRCAKPGEP